MYLFSTIVYLEYLEFYTARTRGGARSHERKQAWDREINVNKLKYEDKHFIVRTFEP